MSVDRRHYCDSRQWVTPKQGNITTMCSMTPLGQRLRSTVCGGIRESGREGRSRDRLGLLLVYYRRLVTITFNSRVDNHAELTSSTYVGSTENTD
ncbi:hypothetical protein J6590_064211 [Homalodisca vitripennis]|nr:hypothetical protein J6590_064211 [Homalodisca vitripennis]